MLAYVGDAMIDDLFSWENQCATSLASAEGFGTFTGWYRYYQAMIQYSASSMNTQHGITQYCAEFILYYKVQVELGLVYR